MKHGPPIVWWMDAIDLMDSTTTKTPEVKPNKMNAAKAAFDKLKASEAFIEFETTINILIES